MSKFAKRWCFKCDLKYDKVFAPRMNDGRAFQRRGAPISNARSPYVVLALGTFRINMSRSLVCNRSFM